MMSRQMKDSGVEWVGEIPYSWEIRKIKNSFCVVSGSTPKTEKQEFWNGSIPWITPADYKTQDKYVRAGRSYLTEEGLASCGTSIIPVGSVIFSKRAPVGTVAINSEELCTNQGCLSCVPKQKISSTYFYYAMSIFTEQFELISSGTTFKEISATAFANFSLPFPSFDEQVKIASYLDDKCSDIDIVMAKTRASIEEYKKLKQALITQAVTKGIRDNRETKDSGIEWIGQYPSDWNLVPFRRILIERSEKNSPIKSTERLSLSIDLGVTLYADKTTNLDRFKDDFEQYKLAHEGDLVMNSMNMIVGASGVSDYFGCVSPVYYTFYDEEYDHATAKFCEYIFRSKTMLRVLFSLGKGIYAIVRGDDKVNTCRLKVSKEDLKSIVIPLPSVDEQREIIFYLSGKCKEVDELIAKKEQFLVELENYKKTLIYEYVTGKKEVQ